MIRTLAFVLLGLAVCAAHGQVYKWVDEQGRTHYSETPPPDKKGAAKKIDTGPSAAPAAVPKDDWKQKEMDAKRRNLERQQAEDAAGRKQAYEENARRNRCLAAQRDLRILEMEAPIYHINEKGERVYLEDRNRPAEMARARAEVDSHCR
jgi:hypothetical protein